MVSSKLEVCYNFFMPNSEFENMDLNDELEFNNGIGDALKQKEEYTFSWKKPPAYFYWELLLFY